MYTPSIPLHVPSSRFSSARFGVGIIALDIIGIASAPQAMAQGRTSSSGQALAAPGARTWHGMTGDGSSAESGIYLYGGTAGPEGNYALLRDFWFYDLGGGAWRPVAVSGRTQPGAKVHPSFSCGPNECVLAHGYPSNSNGSGTDTWIYDKSTTRWAELNCRKFFCPSGRRIAAFLYNEAGRYHLLFGGEGPFTGDVLADTYTFSGGRWQRQNPATSPSARFAAATAYVPPMRTIVLHGGQINYSETPNACDMWAWVGGNWKQVNQSGGPCLAGHNMAWDMSTPTPRLVLTGGYTRWNHMEVNTSVWYFTFNGTYTAGTWVRQDPPGQLGCSYGAAYTGNGGPFYPGSKMATESNTGKKIFFGGEENINGGAVAYAGLIVCD